MFKLNEIRELIRLIDETSVTELNVESAGTKLTIKKDIVGAVIPSTTMQHQTTVPMASVTPVTPASPSVQSAPVVETLKEDKPVTASSPVEDPTLHKIVSPMVGTFYSSPSPDAEPYVSAGSKVNEKTVVCIVEAMKLMNEIEADVRGEVVAVLVENGQLVEYGQPMFLVKKD